MDVELTITGIQPRVHAKLTPSQPHVYLHPRVVADRIPTGIQVLVLVKVTPHQHPPCQLLQAVRRTAARVNILHLDALLTTTGILEVAAANITQPPLLPAHLRQAVAKAENIGIHIIVNANHQLQVPDPIQQLYQTAHSQAAGVEQITIGIRRLVHVNIIQLPPRAFHPVPDAAPTIIGIHPIVTAGPQIPRLFVLLQQVVAGLVGIGTRERVFVNPVMTVTPSIRPVPIHIQTLPHTTDWHMSHPSELFV